jgi:hypothetical protein
MAKVVKPSVVARAKVPVPKVAPPKVVPQVAPPVQPPPLVPQFERVVPPTYVPPTMERAAAIGGQITARLGSLLGPALGVSVQPGVTGITGRAGVGLVTGGGLPELPSFAGITGRAGVGLVTGPTVPKLPTFPGIMGRAGVGLVTGPLLPRVPGISRVSGRAGVGLETGPTPQSLANLILGQPTETVGPRYETGGPRSIRQLAKRKPAIISWDKYLEDYAKRPPLEVSTGTGVPGFTDWVEYGGGGGGQGLGGATGRYVSGPGLVMWRIGY